MAKNLIVFCGSELSMEAGTNRNIDLKSGEWNGIPLHLCSSNEGWNYNKRNVLSFYSERFETIKNTEPLPVHKAIASLQSKYSVVVITSVIDDLLERAGCEDVFHTKGANINYCMCEWHPSITDLGYHVIMDDVNGDHQISCDYVDFHPYPIAFGETCPKCNFGQLRPAIAWSDEPLPAYEVLDQMAKVTETLLCFGNVTSLVPPSFKKISNKILVVSEEINNSVVQQSWDVHIGNLNDVGVEVIKKLL